MGVRLQSMAECRRLAEKNTRLMEENEQLSQRLSTRTSASDTSPRGARGGAGAAPPALAEPSAGGSLGRERGRAASALLKRFSFARRKDKCACLSALCLSEYPIRAISKRRNREDSQEFKFFLV